MEKSLLYFVLLYYSHKSWLIFKTRDRFEICWSWHFQNTPYMCNLTKFWLRYLRLKTQDTILFFSWELIWEDEKNRNLNNLIQKLFCSTSKVPMWTRMIFRSTIKKVQDVSSIAFNSKCSDLNNFPLGQINYNYQEEWWSRLINDMLIYDYDGHQPNSTHTSNVMEVTFICLILEKFFRMKCSFSWI